MSYTVCLEDIGSYVNAYITGTQSATSSTYVNVAWDIQTPISGWTAPTTSTFISPAAAGIYQITYAAIISSSFGTRTASVRLVTDTSTEIPGSQFSITATSSLNPISNTIIVNLPASTTIKLQFANLTGGGSITLVDATLTTHLIV